MVKSVHVIKLNFVSLSFSSLQTWENLLMIQAVFNHKDNRDLEHALVNLDLRKKDI